MSRYQLELPVKINEELSSLTGYVKNSIVDFVCQFEYSTNPENFEFQFVYFHSNLKLVRLSKCSDMTFEVLKKGCIEELHTRELRAYEIFLKGCG